MELERVFVLYGTSNSGKTSTLNELIEILRVSSDEIILDDNIDNNDHRFVCFANGKYVGVSTQGDCGTQVQEHLDVIEKHCNIIFCATRTRGITCAHVVERFGDKLTWIQNLTMYNHKKDAFSNKDFVDARYSQIAKMLSTLVL
ncbi:hypothetical protein [Marinomonas sp.]|uniref:hypothetical protein n=1 Tax=Marinomonas sp. TaxID=1904862 RepID=UPI003BACFA57